MSNQPLSNTRSSATGADLIAESLKRQGVKVIFGIVGIPVVEIAEACIAKGIEFIGFRNEQSAAYAASAYGYLSGRPGICLSVGGPGVVHSLAGVLNAKLNCWPLVLLSGAADTYQTDKGAFQELDQVEACRPYCKYAARPASVDRIPFVIEKAIRTAIAGRPGAAYIDLPADFIQYKTNEFQWIERCQVAQVPNPPISMANHVMVKEAATVLRHAKKPLIVFGKGAAYARAENELTRLVEKTHIPFLPTPMAKGLLSDNHPLCVAAARSKALKEADVVLLVGARLNWILHFGESPKWSSEVKFIHIDVSPEELGNNGANTLPLLGDIKLVLSQLLEQPSLPCLETSSPYVTSLVKTVEENIKKNIASTMTGDDTSILNYKTAYKVIKDILPSKDVFYVSEGANTMDIARSFFDVHEPRHRLDAGTGATMGVGMGYAIAAQIYHPNKRIVSIVGDSAFGFSAMELETAIRAKLPLLIIVINNNGIYYGLESDDYEQSRKSNNLPPTSLSPETRYDMISEACGGKGWLVKNRVELGKAMREALAIKNTTCVVNVLIAPGGRKKLDFGWMNKKDVSKI
ncbi:thiamine pyrophosphate enzyme, N-terminal TPP binding domain-containing protein [Spinellus fusiger]|nr:thiamine pyrophosphate enzyme, N-terminal TPP binding domain-containing protein [Spinellus fusiger]